MAPHSSQKAFQHENIISPPPGEINQIFYAAEEFLSFFIFLRIFSQKSPLRKFPRGLFYKWEVIGWLIS